MLNIKLSGKIFGLNNVSIVNTHIISLTYHNSFLASGNIPCLLITFANCLDPDQDRHNGLDLDPNCLTL